MSFSMEDDVDDNLQRDVPYLYFDMEDLYILTPTKKFDAMLKAKLPEPTLSAFSHWG